MDGVRLLSLMDFCELLRWGIIMGVSPSAPLHAHQGKPCPRCLFEVRMLCVVCCSYPYPHSMCLCR